MEEDEFKDTEIGRIPKDWQIKKFKDCIRVISFKYSLLKSDYQNNISGKYPVIDQSSDYISGYSNEEGKLFNNPLPVIIFGDHTRIFKYINFPFIPAGGGIKILHSNCENLDLKFLYYQFSSFNIPSRGYNRHFIFLQKFLIKVPPLGEQKRITHILSKIENAIKIQDRIINSLQELKKSMMNKLFTEGIGHTEFKDTEIGRIPKEWDIFKLEDIAVVFSGNTAPQEEKYFKNGKYPFIRVRHLTKLENYKYPLKYDLINDEAVNVLKLRKFKRGSIIFPKSGESIKLEKRAILKEDSYIVNHLAVIEPTKKINNLFLFYYLNTVKTNNYLVGTSMPSLQLSIIKKLLIPIPSLDEQNRIAYILSAIDNIISIEEDRKKYFEALFKTMLNKLLTGQIRVKNLEMRE